MNNDAFVKNVASRLIEQIRNGTAPWQKPWRPGTSFLPFNHLALWLNNRAEHGEAEPLYRRALAITEKSFGPDHPNVATGLTVDIVPRFGRFV